MIIIYNDGSTLTCDLIEISGSNLFIDGYRIVSIEDIMSIEDN